MSENVAWPIAIIVCCLIMCVTAVERQKNDTVETQKIVESIDMRLQTIEKFIEDCGK